MESKKIKDGGPAYPSHGTMGEVVCHGLSKREAVAMAAMQGMLANSSRGYTFENLVHEAFRYADAFLERAKR